jgi:hypothetical protein
MMDRTGITQAVTAAQRFVKLAGKIEYEKTDAVSSGPALRGELRRASLDLTRRLAELRRFR